MELTLDRRDEIRPSLDNLFQKIDNKENIETIIANYKIVLVKIINKDLRNRSK